MNIIFQRFFNSKIIKIIKVFALKFVPRSFGDDYQISLICVSQISSVFAFFAMGNAGFRENRRNWQFLLILKANTIGTFELLLSNPKDPRRGYEGSVSSLQSLHFVFFINNRICRAFWLFTFWTYNFSYFLSVSVLFSFCF